MVFGLVFCGNVCDRLLFLFIDSSTAIFYFCFLFLEIIVLIEKPHGLASEPKIFM